MPNEALDRVSEVECCTALELMGREYGLVYLAKGISFVTSWSLSYRTALLLP